MNVELRAYLWTLAALVAVFMFAMVISAAFPHIITELEAFGLGTVVGGLIGLLREPRFMGNMPLEGARKPAERENEG